MKPKKFEYDAVSTISILTKEELDEYGRKGWELVSFNPALHHCNLPYYYIFKREILEITYSNEE